MEPSHCRGGAKIVVPGWQGCGVSSVPALGADPPCVTGRKNPLRRGTAAPGHQRGGEVTHDPLSRSPGPCRGRRSGDAQQQPEPPPFILTVGTFRLTNTLLPFAFPSGSAADNSPPALFTGAKSTPVCRRRRPSTPAGPSAYPWPAGLCRARRGPAADTRASRCLVISTKQPRAGAGAGVSSYGAENS